jgi:replicative DNA helicase
VPPTLQPLSSVLAATDDLLLAGRRATPWTWPTGFGLLDTYLGGGLRAGELCLLGGPQGLGKTTFVLQVARNVVHAGGAAVVMSYEHDTPTLLERLIALEAGSIVGVEGPPLRLVREALQGDPRSSWTLEERLGGVTGGAEAVAALRSYGERLLLHRSLGSATDLDAVEAAVHGAVELTGRRPLVVVDYLQKVFVPGAGTEEDRVTFVVEGLKDLALTLEVPVLAVVAADLEGLTAGRRIRVHHLRGSSALAYEPDVVLTINDKFEIVAKHHLAYDPAGAERFKQHVVLSIEKNRSGLGGIDMELRKRFEQARYDTEAQPVHEQLVDDRVYTE